MKLTQAGKEELALAILLWKDFKSQGKMDVEIMKQAQEFAKNLKIEQEFHALHSQMPAMEIKLKGGE